jgi:hypothetical protein
MACRAITIDENLRAFGFLYNVRPSRARLRISPLMHPN